jgi:para-aminobenzoate synthetase component I
MHKSTKQPHRGLLCAKHCKGSQGSYCSFPLNLAAQMQADITIDWSQWQAIIELPQWKGFRMLWRPNSEKPLLALGARATTHDVGDPELKGHWWFGYISYDLKNHFEKLETRIPHPMGFSDVAFFSPELLIEFSGSSWKAVIDHTDGSWIDFFGKNCSTSASQHKPKWEPLQTADHYKSIVNRLKHHIQIGDIYEVNYCQTFEAHYELEKPFSLFQKINNHTQAPYAAYLQWNQHHVLCASPEQFLSKKGNRLVSAPIKGTIKRGVNAEEDEQLKTQLLNDPKERAENVMIVDLVRNDLSRLASKGSVKVEELFGIYSFKTVHHMISTISCEMKEDYSLREILNATFPMGSMTGAPKIRAMQLIDEYESASRGVYSGSLGVITPEGDMDWNVVIRTLLYDEEIKMIRCTVGGAITSLCDAESEYQECLLKGKAVMHLPFD